MQHETPKVQERPDEARSRSRGALPRVSFTEIGTREAGNSFGYSLLTKRIRESFEHDPEAPVALTCITPDWFEPVPGKVNIVFSMWESDSMEARAIERLSKADVLVVPSGWNAEIARRYLDIPVEVVNLGHDPAVWKYRTRRWPDPEGKPFRWLWNAAPNPRKGWVTLSKVWEELFSTVNGCELYVKTSGPGEDMFRKRGNMMFDSRRLSTEDLVALYESAHGFVYPSMGEGWGLTLHEAMASGVPCVSTTITGHSEFANAANVFEVETASATIPARPGRESVEDDGSYLTRVPSAASLALQMAEVMSNYPAARTKAKRASRRVSGLTWSAFSLRLAEVVGRHVPR